VIPQDIRYRVTLPSPGHRVCGVVLELYQGHFALPELGPIGSISFDHPDPSLFTSSQPSRTIPGQRSPTLSSSRPVIWSKRTRSVVPSKHHGRVHGPHLRASLDESFDIALRWSDIPPQLATEKSGTLISVMLYSLEV
jgi:homogentisate 1,2-dioxygenase